MDFTYENELKHWGIKGQKWGQRRYRNEDGSLTEEGRKRYTNSKNIRKDRLKFESFTPEDRTYIMKFLDEEINWNRKMNELNPKKSKNNNNGGGNNNNNNGGGNNNKKGGNSGSAESLLAKMAMQFVEDRSKASANLWKEKKGKALDDARAKSKAEEAEKEKRAQEKKDERAEKKKEKRAEKEKQKAEKEAAKKNEVKKSWDKYFDYEDDRWYKEDKRTRTKNVQKWY